MPSAGNHENERGNGPIGYGAYQTYFALPDAKSDAEVRGLWLARLGQHKGEGLGLSIAFNSRWQMLPPSHK